MAVIGISGKIGSGKDTLGQIIQYLIAHKGTGLVFPPNENDFKDWLNKYKGPEKSTWKVRKMADALKNTVCGLIDCTREQLEDNAFKDSLLGDEWQIWEGYSKLLNKRFNNVIFYNKEEAEEWSKTHDDFTYVKSQRTVRWLLQFIGTELFRQGLHINVHINALFSAYKVYNPSQELIDRGKKEGFTVFGTSDEFPKWLITDVRFENEAKVIKNKGGILLRVNRKLYNWEYEGKQFSTDTPYLTGYTNILKSIPASTHPSETSLDDYKEFDEIIDNNGTINDLIKNVDLILIKYKIYDQ